MQAWDQNVTLLSRDASFYHKLLSWRDSTLFTSGQLLKRCTEAWPAPSSHHGACGWRKRHKLWEWKVAAHLQLILVFRHRSPDKGWRTWLCHGCIKSPCGSYSSSLCFFMVSLARNPPGDHMDPAHSTMGDLALGLSRSFSSSASKCFLHCLLFPATSALDAHVAEFARVDSISQEGSIAAFQLVLVWFSYFTYAWGFCEICHHSAERKEKTSPWVKVIFLLQKLLMKMEVFSGLSKRNWQCCSENWKW